MKPRLYFNNRVYVA